MKRKALIIFSAAVLMLLSPSGVQVPLADKDTAIGYATEILEKVR